MDQLYTVSLYSFMAILTASHSDIWNWITLNQFMVHSSKWWTSMVLP